MVVGIAKDPIGEPTGFDEIETNLPDPKGSKLAIKEGVKKQDVGEENDKGQKLAKKGI